MIPKLSGNIEKIYLYLQSIYPKGATNSEIEETTRIHPHAQVFQLTKKLTEQGFLHASKGGYGEREWVFHVKSPEEQPFWGRLAHKSVELEKDTKSNIINNDKITPKEFEQQAARIMSEYYGVSLCEGRVAGVPKLFDLVSKDGNVVGDAKYFTLVGGKNNPPAKFSVIAEHVWLLEKTQASHKFIVFGNQREVPVKWLRRYGHLSAAVLFFFIDDQSKLEVLA